MPPQPFSTIVGDGESSIQFGARSTIEKRPVLAAKAAEVIAVASEIDTMLGDTLTSMLGAESEPALAMYAALQSPKVQNDAMMAVARVKLNERTQDLMDTVLAFAGSAMQDRHKLAHWHWGISHRHDNLLLLRKPDDHRAQDRWLSELMKRGTGDFGGDALADLRKMFKSILAYRDIDLDEAIDRLGKVRRAIARLHKLIDPENQPPADEIWRKLLQEPAIAEGLKLRTAKRKAG